MPYRLKRKESVQQGIQRIATEQIQRALNELQDPALGNNETVHQVRKRCKKVRGALRLVRPALGGTYSKENSWYRDAARTLSSIRDAEAMIETYHTLLQRFRDDLDGRVMRPIYQALERRKRSITADADRTKRLLERFEGMMTEGLVRISPWCLSMEDYNAISGGLNKTYGRARKAMTAAYANSTPESFHEWRKRVKYHWYHMRILCDIWPEAMRFRRNAVDRLGTLLGDHHDLSVLRALILSDPQAFAKNSTIMKFTGCIELHLRQIEDESRPLGKRLFAENPKRFVQRFEAYWKTWRQ